MKKKGNILNWNLLIILLMMLAFIQPKTLAATQIRLIIDGQDITSSALPIIENGRTLVPIRIIAEQMGAQVNWNGDDRTVQIVKGDNLVLLRIDSHLVENENKEKTYSLCDVPPRIINGRTFVPLRLVANTLGLEIEWDDESKSVYIDSNKASMATPFFDTKILSHYNGQVITGKAELQIKLPSTDLKDPKEIKYLLLDPKTAQGHVVARGNKLDAIYNWTPNLNDNGERVLVAAIYDGKGRFLSGDSILVHLDIIPQASLTGLTEGQIINDTISVGADVSFVASYVKYEITNLDKNKTIVSAESDPNGVYKWMPMSEDNGNYSFKVIAYDDNENAYESKIVNAKVEVIRRLSLLGVSSGRTIDKPVTLSVSRNFQVSGTEYIMKDPNTGTEEILAKVGYQSYKWFPGPEVSGTKELLVRVKDTKGVTYESNSISVSLPGTPKMILDGVGPNQVVTGDIKLKTISNIPLDSVEYILVNPATGEKKAIASNQDPLIEYTYSPTKGDVGQWKIQAIGAYNSGKKIMSEEIPYKVYLDKTYSALPIIEKSQFLGLASELAKNSWEETGMSAALQTAQAILETGWGQSVPVDKYNGKLSNNLFGIKGSSTAGSVISNTWEEYNGNKFRIDAEFRAYNTINESWADHKSLLLNSSRYEPFREVMHDSTLGAWALKTAGYATDSQYPMKLMQIIKLYDLQKLDRIGI